MAGKLHHPNIVSVYGMGVEQDTPYFAMELVEGETLAAVLRREPPAPDAFQSHCLYMASAFADVADGLQHAHAGGVVHRDIKPSNLIVDGDRHIRILDFGLARLEGQDALTVTGDFLGTPQYMSPEQARRQKVPVDHRTDIYSLGATFYEALVRRPPHEGRDREDTLSRIIERDPRPPRQLNPRVPAELETIVLKCLRKDPDDRYRTAEALAQDLRRFVRGDPIEARPQGRWQRLRRRVAREKLRLFVAGTAAVLVLACAVLAWRLSVESMRQRSQEYDRTVVAAAMKLLRGETILAGVRGSRAEGVSLLPAEYDRDLVERGKAAIVEALQDLERARELLPERFEAYYHRGRALLMLRRGNDAVGELEEALGRNPGFAPALVLRTQARGEDDDPDLTTDPRGAAWRRAQRAMRKWRFDEAIAAWDELVALEGEAGELYPGSRTIHLLGRGTARLWAEDYDGAVLDFWAARTRSQVSWGELLEPHLLLGMTYFLRGNPGDLDRADERLREAARLCGSPEEGDVWTEAIYSLLVRRCWLRERFPAAIEAARRVARLCPHDMKARLTLGRTLLARVWLVRHSEGGAEEGDLSEAFAELLDVAEGALQLDRMSPAAHDFMGKTFAFTGELDRARSSFAKAQSLLESEVSQRRFDMKNTDGRAAAAVASLVVVLTSAGKAQEGRFEDVRPVESVGGEVNSPLGEMQPCLSSDGRQLYFVSFRNWSTSTSDIYVAWRGRRGEPWAGVRPLDELNTPAQEREPSLSHDGLTLYFHSEVQSGLGRGDIFVAHRESPWDPDGRPARFGEASLLDEVDSDANDNGPCISRDGLELFFQSKRTGGLGDLYVARRRAIDLRFGEPTPLASLNTPNHERSPSLSCDGLALFYSTGPAGRSGGRIMVATRANGESDFGVPVPLGPPVDTGDLYAGGHPDISCDWPADGAVLHFGRSVGGARPAIYQATWRRTDTPGIGPFLRGDCDANGSASGDPADAVALLRYKFAGASRPPCLAACDADGDGSLGGVTDAVYMLGFSFLGGPSPVAPYPACARSTRASDVALGCDEPLACP